MNTLIPYEAGFPPDTIIGEYDLKIRNILKKQLKPGDLFINTTWIGADEQLDSVLSQNFKRILLYSGIDWNVLPDWRPEPYEILKDYRSITVGNDLSGYYFSFWLDFVYEYLDNYVTFDPYEVKSGIKTYMCLNRKPHSWRQYVVKQLYDRELQDRGYISLGLQKDYEIIYDIPTPILLETDVVDKQGDAAAYGANSITNDITSVGHRGNWNDHFLNIVTESVTDTNVFISEKTFKPIMGKRPFIVLGDRRTYSMLHKWGIDTFDDILGVGYRRESYEGRVDWCMNAVEALSKDKHLDKLLLELRPRLDQNLINLKQAAVANRRDINDFYNTKNLI